MAQKFEDYFCNETLTTLIDNSITDHDYNAEFELRKKVIKISLKIADI